MQNFICVFLRFILFFSANTQKTIKANKRLQQQQFIGQNQETKEPLKEHEQEIIINFPSYDDNCCDIFCFCKTLVLFSIMFE